MHVYIVEVGWQVSLKWRPVAKSSDFYLTIKNKLELITHDWLFLFFFFFLKNILVVFLI